MFSGEQLAHAPHGSLTMIDHSRYFVMIDQPGGAPANRTSSRAATA
jgi:hypothetical protein